MVRQNKEQETSLHSKLCNSCGSALNAAHNFIKVVFLPLTVSCVTGSQTPMTSSHMYMIFLFQGQQKAIHVIILHLRSCMMEINILIYIFQPPVEDCTQYSSPPSAEQGQRRAMKKNMENPSYKKWQTKTCVVGWLGLGLFFNLRKKNHLHRIRYSFLKERMVKKATNPFFLALKTTK